VETRKQKELIDLLKNEELIKTEKATVKDLQERKEEEFRATMYHQCLSAINSREQV
jgi:hypothetical protein